VTSAIILAGGLGTRLRSVVSDLPKPLAPIHGRPFLEYQMDYWISQGVDTFILSLGYLHNKIINYFGATYRTAKLEYVIEKSPLGTGGGLLLAMDKVRESEFILVINGDTFFEVNLQGLTKFTKERNADWTFALFETTDFERYSSIKIDKTQKIIQIGIKSKKDDSGYANGGVYLLKTEILFNKELRQKFQSNINTSLEKEIFPYLINHNAQLFGYFSKGLFLDIGTPNDYKKSFELFKKQERKEME